MNTFNHKAKHSNGNEFIASSVSDTAGLIQDGAVLIRVAKERQGKFRATSIKIKGSTLETPLFGGVHYSELPGTFTLNYVPYIKALSKVFEARNEAADITRKIDECAKQLEELQKKAVELGLVPSVGEPQHPPLRPLTF